MDLKSTINRQENPPSLSNKGGDFSLTNSFCPVMISVEEVEHFLPESSLYNDFSIFHGPAHATFILEQPGKFLEVIFSSDKPLDESNGFPPSLLRVENYPKALLFRI